jgi:hypothetical protein
VASATGLTKVKGGTAYFAEPPQTIPNYIFPFMGIAQQVQIGESRDRRLAPIGLEHERELAEPAARPDSRQRFGLALLFDRDLGPPGGQEEAAIAFPAFTDDHGAGRHVRLVQSGRDLEQHATGQPLEARHPAQQPRPLVRAEPAPPAPAAPEDESPGSHGSESRTSGPRSKPPSECRAPDSRRVVAANDAAAGRS